MADSDERRWGSGGRRGRRGAAKPTSYYNLPVIKKPHWKWLIIWYFFLGGLSAGSAVIAGVARLLDGAPNVRIARAGHYLALAALLPSPILLILDLGRPERFHHMLRVVKLRSPMSLGTWGLTIFGGFCGLSALIQAAEDGLLRPVPTLARLLSRLPARTIAAGGGLLGFFVGGYTGVLLAATAVPLWAKNALLMGPLFLGSAMGSAAAALTLVLATLRGRSHAALERLERLELVVLLAELGLHAAAWRGWGPVIGRPLRTGRLGQLYRWGVLGAGLIGPLALRLIAPPSRVRSALGALLTLAGGFLLRYSMVMGGRASADDPQATFELTRG